MLALNAQALFPRKAAVSLSAHQSTLKSSSPSSDIPASAAHRRALSGRAHRCTSRRMQAQPPAAEATRKFTRLIA
eukprot:6207636-Pleurochrysis_carterae.AAC.1